MATADDRAHDGNHEVVEVLVKALERDFEKLPLPHVGHVAVAERLQRVDDGPDGRRDSVDIRFERDGHGHRVRQGDVIELEIRCVLGLDDPHRLARRGDDAKVPVGSHEHQPGFDRIGPTTGRLQAGDP